VNTTGRVRSVQIDGGQRCNCRFCCMSEHIASICAIPQVKSSIGRVLVAVWTRQLCAAFWNFWFRRRCEWVSRSTGNFADLRVGELFLAFRAGHDPTWRHTYRAANQVNPCSRIEAFLVLCAEALTPTHNLATCAGHIFRRFRATSTTKYVYFTADKCAHMM